MIARRERKKQENRCSFFDMNEPQKNLTGIFSVDDILNYYV
jgi:hypothetical protein